VDEDMAPPQKLVLRTVRAENTKLTKTSVLSVTSVAKQKTMLIRV
jgi:hypothetical protein